jgi:hypothetical protein
MKIKKKIKKLTDAGRVIPAGTKQETGFSRFIKKEKMTGAVRIIKDAKANNEDELEGKTD